MPSVLLFPIRLPLPDVVLKNQQFIEIKKGNKKEIRESDENWRDILSGSVVDFIPKDFLWKI